MRVWTQVAVDTGCGLRCRDVGVCGHVAGLAS